ncbi:MAG: uroporphyrinogen-III C-methyltransferase [Gammaproteobacteria bacterium]|nr:uroporphyrinogen-III C-methyltransferase [Gammaproteobacteria bacterium]
MSTNKRKKNSRDTNNPNKSRTNESEAQQTDETSTQSTNADIKTASSDESIIMQQGEKIKTMAPNANDTSKSNADTAAKIEAKIDTKAEIKAEAKTDAKEAKKANKTTPTPAPVMQKSSSGFATFLASAAFILSVGAGGGGYWTWQQIQIDKNQSASTIATLQQQLEEELQKAQAALKNDVNATKAAIQSELSQTSAAIKSELSDKANAIESMTKNIETATNIKIAGAEERFLNAQAELGKANHNIIETQKRQQSLEASIDGLYSRIGNTSRDWVIAEADYLLKIANHRLQLEQDVTTSIQALTLADNRINSLSDPALNEVRNVIAQELITLQTLAIPDQAGVSMQLSELQAKIDQLPLNARTQPVQKDQSPANADEALQVDTWDALPLAIMNVLKDLVAVNYNDKPIEPLLSPEQVKHLHENLKLKLEQARMVLLRGDQNLYKANIDLAINWTEKFFNTEEVSTKKFVDTLNYLKTKQVVLQIPDISSSLRTLRKVAKRLEINSPGAQNNVSDAIAIPAADVAMNLNAN